jgi:hypothetical protein
MLNRLAIAGLLLLGGCAYDAGYYDSNYASQPGSVAGYYSSVDYSTPYQPSSPVWGSPYVSGPVIGPIYGTGDERDVYGGPVFSPYHGIHCDRRRNQCWGRNGPDDGWSARFFGRRHVQWNDGDGHNGNWHHGNWNGGGNPKAWVYKVPLEPDGRGAPTFPPNGCGANGQPPC